jgi:hypothetical protein
VEDSEKENGPDIPVWSWLWQAIDSSTDELRALTDEDRRFVEKVGTAIAKSRTDFVLRPESGAVLINEIAEDLLSDAWVRHGAEIEIASIGIKRTEASLQRFLSLKPITTTKTVPDRAKVYLREVIDTFLLGFDPACIALCRATYEQVLRDELVRGGFYTEARLKRERPTAGNLVMIAKREKLLVNSIRAAERLVKKGDNVMHSFIYEERILEQQALDSIQELAEVLSEMLS